MKKMYLWLLCIIASATAYSQQEYPSNEVGNNSTAVGASLSNFQARQNNNGVQLLWTALDESNMLSHEIEKSANGSSFTVVGRFTARNSAAPFTYTYADATPVEGINYYRVRSTDKNGVVTYSRIMQVDNSYRKSELRIIPNPVQNGMLNMQLNNFSGGKYVVSLLSSSGQRILARTLDISDGSVVQSVALPSGLARGTYMLQLTNGETSINRQVVVQ